MRFYSKHTHHSPRSDLHHYIVNSDGYKSRIHLRIDPDGIGTLIINSNRIIHLNPTAAFMAQLMLENESIPSAVKRIKSQFQVSKKAASSDYIQFSSDFNELINPDSCPICAVDNIEVITPFSTEPSAPYRMDLALTYRCNNNCSHCYNGRPRNYPELSTAKWEKIIDRVWDLGIPHLVFTGGEPTLRDDLPDLIAYAENKGQLTGINTNGRRLSDPTYVEKLIKAGLDHVQITLESHDSLIHDEMVAKNGAWKQTVQGIRNVLDTPLFVMTNTTMLVLNSPTIALTLDFLGKLGVPTIGLNALIYSGKGLTVGTGLNESRLPPLLELARKKTSKHNQKLIWYTPTQYCHFDPTQLELGIKGCSAALYNMCIEPDGSVIPCQSYYQTLGDITKDSWDSIWNHELSVSLRKRHYISEECQECILLPECGGGCPLTYQSQQNQEIKKTRIPVSSVTPFFVPDD